MTGLSASTTTDLRARQLLITGVFGLFFASGFSALVYQTAWQRLLGLFGGADTVAASLAVGAFLLGLGLGSLIAGGFADRLSRRSAYLSFGLVELGIGAFGAISTWVFYDVLFLRLIGLSGWPLVVFGVAFLALLWPTILMGMSLPILARALVRDVATSSATIGWLYAVNTLGAATGCFVAGWWLIGTYGYQVAIAVAAAINIAVGLGALAVWALRFDPDMLPARTDRVGRLTVRPKGILDIPSVVRRWCALVFVSGFLIISLQIVWYRVLGTLMDSSAYSFSLVLGMFLVGDTIGLIWGADLARRLSDPRRFFLWMQGAVVLYSVGIIWVLYQAFQVDGVSRQFVDTFIVERDAVKLALVTVLTAIIVLPGSILIGMSFPLVQKAIQTDPDLVGHRVGLIQLANIAGNSLGGLVTGLVLLHLFGTAGTLRIVLMIGLGFLILLWLTDGGARRLGNAALAAAIILLVMGFPSGEALWSRLHGLRAGERGMLEEDRTGVVFLRQGPDNRAKLYIGGHSQSCIPFCTVHSFLGILGPLIHPKPDNVLVIGIGSGGTPYAAGVRPETRRIDAIEIVAPVLDVLDRFVEAGGRAGIDRLLLDQRFKFEVGDGRHALFTSENRWDVIEADAVLPQTANSGTLYSREYYEEVRASLKPGGLAVKWAPTERVISTFLDVFPYVTMIHPALIGSDQPIDVSSERLVSQLERPEVRAYLLAADINIDQLRGWFESKQAVVWTPADRRPDIEANTDLFPRDEYYLNNDQVFSHGPTTVKR